MNKVLAALQKFRKERDWKQFHSPQNLAKSIVLEAAEILEIFQWKDTGELTKKEVEDLGEELADVYNWLILLAHDLNINLEEEALKKIKKNNEKYPADKVRGKAKKYTEL